MSGFGDGEALVGTDVVGAVGLAVGEHGPEPDGEVGHVEPGAAGCAVALDVDGGSVDGRAEEVADGEVLVKGEMRADEGEAAGDDWLELRVGGVGDAEVFGHALGFVVGALQEQGVGCAGVGFRRVLECGGASVDGSGAGVEETGCAGGLGEAEDMLRAGEDGLGEFVGGTVGLLATGVGGGVEYVGVGLGGEGEGADVVFEERDCGVVCDVWGLEADARCAAREDGGADVEVELAVRVEEGLEEPMAEGAGAAGDEDVSVAQGEERVAGEREDVGEVLVGKWLVCHVVSMPCDRESCCWCEP